MKFDRAILATLTGAILIYSTLPSSAADPYSTNTLVEGNSDFAFDLYSKLSNRPGNLFFSPYSISTCLAMVYAGARGDTAKQMAQTLHFKASPTELPLIYGNLQHQVQSLQSTNGVQLNIANGLWGQEKHPFLPEFLQTAQQNFAANLRQVDFQTQADAARDEINSWVSDQTKNKINNLIAPGALNADTRLVLVNAIYFKGRWLNPFRSQQTAPAPFAVTYEKKVQVPMMHIQGEFRYAEETNCQILVLPYMHPTTVNRPEWLSNQTNLPTQQQIDRMHRVVRQEEIDEESQVSMVILLPKKTQDLNRFERSLSARKMKDWFSSASREKVNVFLPKFKTTSEFQLGSTLKSLGMTQAFSRTADFSGIDNARDLFISSVVHKAFVDVDEEGTAAAAATGVTLEANAIMRPRPVPVFRADHPFIFLILDERSGSILFMGRMGNPAE